MIEKMKKVSIVLLNSEKEAALKALRKTGLLHLEKIEGSSEKLNTFKEYSNNALLTESILGEIKVPKKKSTEVKKLSDSEIIDLCSKVCKNAELKKQLMDEITADTNELERFLSWG